MKKALVIIDVQKGFLGQHTKHLPLRIKRFIAQKGAGYDLIIFTQYRNHPKSNFVKQLGYRGFMRESEYDIVDELKEFVKKDNLFPKYTYSSFITKQLPHTLKKHNISEVHLCGIETENCVLTFARDAFDRGYKVVVFRELCGSYSNQNLRIPALQIIKDNIGEVR